MVLRPASEPLMTARLVLLTGSQAGIEAPLQRGYYMIGRHKECQIRPKSRSVSRRHCVLHFHDDRLLAMDLASTSGSKRNTNRFEPKKWVPLEDGDTLKLGKVQFRVCLEALPADGHGPSTVIHPPGLSDSRSASEHPLEKTSPATEASGHPESVRASVNGIKSSGTNGKVPTNGMAAKSKPSPPPGERPKRPASMVSGAAWETFDVAEFLHDEDNFDREERYDQIRSKNMAAQKAAEQQWLSDESSGDSIIDPFDDDSVLDDTLHEGESGSLTDSDIFRSDSNDEELGDPTTKPPQRPRLTPLPPRKREFSMPGWLRPGGDVDSWKLIAAIVLTVAVLGLSGWKIFQFIQGPEVRVLQELN